MATTPPWQGWIRSSDIDIVFGGIKYGWCSELAIFEGRQGFLVLPAVKAHGELELDKSKAPYFMPRLPDGALWTCCTEEGEPRINRSLESKVLEAQVTPEEWKGAKPYEPPHDRPQATTEDFGSW